MCLGDCTPSPQVQPWLSAIPILCKYWFRPILPVRSCINTKLCTFRKPRYSFLDFLIGTFKRRLIGTATFIFFHASAYSSTAFCWMTRLAANASLHCLHKPHAASSLPVSTATLAYLSASSFPRIPSWLGIQWINTSVPRPRRIRRKHHISLIISWPDGCWGR
jgi:hypothetical protein